MAKLRMTYKNLKALRKSREYQAVIIDLVSAGILTKSKAEEMLEYNIPAALLAAEDTGNDTPIVTPDNGGSETTETTDDPTPIVMEVQISVDRATPITVGTFTIPADTEAITLDDVCDTLEGPFDDSYFTPNEAWSNDYANSDYYTIGSAEFKDPDNDFATVPLSTALSDLPVNTVFCIPISTVSSSSSS